MIHGKLLCERPSRLSANREIVVVQLIQELLEHFALLFGNRLQPGENGCVDSGIVACFGWHDPEVLHERKQGHVGKLAMLATEHQKRRLLCGKHSAATYFLHQERTVRLLPDNQQVIRQIAFHQQFQPALAVLLDHDRPLRPVLFAQRDADRRPDFRFPAEKLDDGFRVGQQQLAVKIRAAELLRHPCSAAGTAASAAASRRCGDLVKNAELLLLWQPFQFERSARPIELQEFSNRFLHILQRAALRERIGFDLGERCTRGRRDHNADLQRSREQRMNTGREMHGVLSQLQPLWKPFRDARYPTEQTGSC